MRIGIFGKGRLATAVAAAVETSGDLELAWSADRGEEPACPVDVALDASVADAVPAHLAWAVATGTDFVIGTTGWDRAALGALGPEPRIGVLAAPNFSLAVAFVKRVASALGRFAAASDGAALSVFERHHAGKADAPSGTAKLLAAALASSSGRTASPGCALRGAGIVPVASLRSGDAIGYHELRCESPLETIVVSHDARSRSLFAAGAVAALRWIKGRKGIFSFDDLAAELIDPMFAPDGRKERAS